MLPHHLLTGLAKWMEGRPSKVTLPGLHFALLIFSLVVECRVPLVPVSAPFDPRVELAVPFRLRLLDAVDGVLSLSLAPE